MLGIAVMGVVAYRVLAVSDLPNVDFPTLNVGASLPGGDPATLASAVASPLERQFTTIAGIDEMTSSSSTGSSNVTLQFDRSRDAAAARGHAGAAVVPQVQSVRLADHVPRADLEDDPDVAARRLRRE